MEQLEGLALRKHNNYFHKIAAEVPRKTKSRKKRTPSPPPETSAISMDNEKLSPRARQPGDKPVKGINPDSGE